MGTRDHWCLPAVAEEEGQDEAMLEGCSPEHEQQRGGGVATVKSSGGLSSAREQRRVRESSGVMGKGDGCSGVVLTFYRRKRMRSGGSNRW
jgi:hypothetical protein